MVRFVVQRLPIAWLGIAASGLVACSTDDDIAAPPHGPPDLRIDAVATVESIAEPTTNGGTLNIDCTEPLLVWIGPPVIEGKLGDFLLAPPGGCGEETNCGWMVLTASTDNGNQVGEARGIQSPLRLDLPVLADPNSAVILRLELRDSKGSPVVADDGQPLSAAFSVNLTQVCQSP